jgi:hypothetical protein
MDLLASFRCYGHGCQDRDGCGRRWRATLSQDYLLKGILPTLEVCEYEK